MTGQFIIWYWVTKADERTAVKTRRSGAVNLDRSCALAAVTLFSFLIPLNSSSINVALPRMARELSMDAVSMGWVPTAYILAAATLLLPLGRLADIYGRSRIFLLGAVVFTTSSLLLGLAPSARLVILLRVTQGAGSALAFATGIAILSLLYPAGERGKVLGINVAATYSGLSMGPFFGGILTEHLGWRSIFFVNVPIGLVIIGLSLWALKQKEPGAADREGFDFPGALIYCIALVLTMLGFSALPAPSGGVYLAGGALAMLLFWFWERKTRFPLLNVDLLGKNRVFVLSNAAALVNYSATFAVGFLFSLYLQHIRGLSPQGAGLVLVSQPLVQAILSPLAGRVSDRVEPRFVASAGMVITAVGLFLLASVKGETGMGFIVAYLAVLGLGFALFSSPNNNAIMSSVESGHYGIASSMLATMRFLGQMFSMAIAMILFGCYMGRVEIGPLHYPVLLRSVRIALLISGVLCTLGIYASFARGNLHGKGER